MENNNNKSLKTKLSNAFNGAKETIKNTSEAIKQGAEKIGTGLTKTAAGIVIGASLLTGCAQINDPMQYEEQPAIEQVETESTIENEFVSIPAEKVVKHLSYNDVDEKGNLQTGIMLYNHFDGCVNLDIEYDTLNEDVAQYLSKSDFFQFQFDNFENDLQDRPRARHFFDDYLTEGKAQIAAAKQAVDGKNDFTPFIESAANLGFDMIKKMVDLFSQGNRTNAVWFYCQFALLHNEAYRFGLGDLFDKCPDLQQKYVDKLYEIEKCYKAAYPHRNFTDEQIADYLGVFKYGMNGFKPVRGQATGYGKLNAAKINWALARMTNEMGPIGPDVNIYDLLKVISYSLNASSLQGMHDYINGCGYHKDDQCEITTANPADMLRDYIESKYQEQNAQPNERKTKKDIEKLR